MCVVEMISKSVFHIELVRVGICPVHFGLLSKIGRLMQSVLVEIGYLIGAHKVHTYGPEKQVFIYDKPRSLSP